MAKITAFLSVFEEKLAKHKRNIKKELDKAKAEKRNGNREFLKKELALIKSLKQTVQEMQEQVAQEVECPHCKKKFKINGR